MSEIWEAEVEYRHGMGGLVRVPAREAIETLAQELRDMPVVAVAALIGHHIWFTGGLKSAGALLLLPYETAKISYAHIRSVPAEHIECGGCGTELRLSDTWLRGGRVLCAECAAA
jgi:hypothetical protein